MSGGDDRLVPAVVGITVVALSIRTIELGARIFHWDEGRVGYWVYRFHQTGEFSYRPIIHGPFVPVVDNAVFDLLGATDFAARLPVAVVGGLLPLVALLLRDHLSDRETVALAVLLAVDPTLVYYSRFVRSDVLVGAFAVTSFALVVAALSRRRTALVVPAAASLALAFTAKENALVYVACFAGASVVLIDHRLVTTASRTGSGVDAAVDAGLAFARRLDDWTAGGRVRHAVGDRWGRRVGIAAHLAVWVPVVTAAALGTFLAVFVFFYAPRPDLWQALAGSRPLGPVVTAGSVGAVERFAAQWVTASHGNPYPAYLADLGETLAYGSGVTVALAVVGFLADGYRSGSDETAEAAVADGGDPSAGSRSLVAFAGYWALASLIGYPVATDIQAPWAAVHVVLPASIPAAVGAARLFDVVRGLVAGASLDRPPERRRERGDDTTAAGVGKTDPSGAGLERGDAVDVVLAGLVVLAVVGGVVGANVDYWNAAGADDEQVIQWAQPDNELKRVVPVLSAVADDGDPDLLYVGTVRPGNRERLLYVANETSDAQPPARGGWFDRLPLPWYTATRNVTVTSSPPDARFDGLPSDPPPVVIAYSFDREELAQRLPGYAARTYDFRLWRDEVTVFVDRETLASLDPAVAAPFRDAVGRDVPIDCDESIDCDELMNRDGRVDLPTGEVRGGSPDSGDLPTPGGPLVAAAGVGVLFLATRR